MHFEVLVEDQSGKNALDAIIPQIVAPEHTFRVIAYKGLGRIPQNMRDTDKPARRILLDCLPKLLKGYGRTYAGYGANYRAAVLVVCDLDDECHKTFRQRLLSILAACKPAPRTQFCFAVEEGEAWLLGDLSAIRQAYPDAKDEVLNNYRNDSVCGTWETLADAIYPGGAEALQARGWQGVGAEKSKWAAAIAGIMSVDNNQSGSFCYFRDKLRAMAASP